MSILYAESNSESTADLFRKKLMYRKKAKSSANYAKNIVNFTIGEKKLYGKVDSNFTPIFLKYTSNLKVLKNSNNETPLYAFNFVADLFNEMVLEFERCAAEGKIDTEDPFLSSLKVYKAFEDPTRAYNNYQNIFFEQVKQKFISNNIMVEDFGHFLKHFSSIVRRLSKSVPFTMSAFVKSDMNSIMTSGLAIEISDLEYENDYEKVENFINSKNWKFFVNACNKYGFIIDHNIPWRIICDVKAPEIQLVRGKYYSSTEQFFQFGFNNAPLESFLRLPSDLLGLYNQIKRKKFNKQVKCGKKYQTKVIIPKAYTLNDILLEYGLTYFAKLYMNLRLSEEKPDLDDNGRKRIIDDVLSYIDMTGDYLAVHNYFEIFLNKPFDKRYSHTYNRNIRHPAILPILEAQRRLGQGMTASDTISAMTSY